MHAGYLEKTAWAGCPGRGFTASLLHLSSLVKNNGEDQDSKLMMEVIWGKTALIHTC